MEPSIANPCFENNTSSEVPHRCANKVPVEKILFIFKQLLFGINVLRINYPSVEVSRTCRSLQEDQSQDVLSSGRAEFHILIPIQAFVLEKT